MTAVPVAYQLFGPVQMNAALTQATGTSFSWVGSALSASTVRFGFHCGLARVKEARWLQIWASRSVNNIARLVHCDDGPSNIKEIAQIAGDGRPFPSAQAVDITAALNALVAGGVYKHIGFQVKGDGVTQWALYESVVEVVWDLANVVGEPGPPGPPGPPGSIPGSFNAMIAVTP